MTKTACKKHQILATATLLREQFPFIIRERLDGDTYLYAQTLKFQLALRARLTSTLST